VLLRRVPSRRVRDLAIKAGVVEIDSGSYCQGGCPFLKQVKSASTLLRVQIVFTAVVAVAAAGPSRELVVLGLSIPQGQVRSKFAPCLARSDLGSLHALQAD
jgi:hypothetical protein